MRHRAAAALELDTYQPKARSSTFLATSLEEFRNRRISEVERTCEAEQLNDLISKRFPRASAQKLGCESRYAKIANVLDIHTELIHQPFQSLSKLIRAASEEGFLDVGYDLGVIHEAIDRFATLDCGRYLIEELPIATTISILADLRAAERTVA